LYNWHKLDIDVTSLAEGKPTEAMAGSKRIGLLKKGEGLHAFAALCPHAGAPMCEGWVDGLGRLVCPLHKYRFDPKNGRNTSGEGYKLFTYPIELREDGAYVGLRE
jgi:3-phenylpropionate/trans-cinnamate dioxygenase ferredoxin subunit